MKKFARYAGMLAGMFVVAAVVSSAQTVALRVDIPFQFNIREKVLPPGQYLIQAPQGGTLRISGANGVAAIAMTNRISGRGPGGVGMVDFNCYGQRCFLSQFWMARTDVGLEVIKSRMEKEAASTEQVAKISLRATPDQAR